MPAPRTIVATETANPSTRGIDLLPTSGVLRLLHRQDASVATAVRRCLPALTRAVDAIRHRFLDGGRVIYVGAGTSGRLATLDAAELPPTFGVRRARVIAVMAGGTRALTQAIEGAEDNTAAATRDLRSLRLTRLDSVIGIAASGRTPYTVTALRFARSRGCLTIAVACTSHSPLAAVADVAVVANTGPEAIAGSTRLKAGTAQKMILNLLSTALMVRTGYVFDNRMVNVVATNAKLRARAAGILQIVAGAPAAAAPRLLREAQGDLKVAILCARLGGKGSRGIALARRRLAAAGGDLRRALEKAGA